MAVQELSPHTTEHARLSKAQVYKRQAFLSTLGALFPTELRQVNNAISRAEFLMQSDEQYGLVVPINHISLSDPARIISSVLLASDVFMSRHVVIPATKYFGDQLERIKIISLCENLGIDVPFVMTESSWKVELEKAEMRKRKAESAGQLQTFTRRILHLDQDFDEKPVNGGGMAYDYINTAIAALQEGGIVFLSTQGGRRRRVEVPEKNSKRLFQLCRGAENSKTGDSKKVNIAVMPVTIYYADSDIDDRYNFFDRSVIVVGEVEKYDDIRARAIAHGITVDQDIYESLAFPLDNSLKSLEYWDATSPHDVYSRRK